jgi:hypothetical protein
VDRGNADATPLDPLNPDLLDYRITSEWLNQPAAIPIVVPP